MTSLTYLTDSFKNVLGTRRGSGRVEPPVTDEQTAGAELAASDRVNVAVQRGLAALRLYAKSSGTEMNPAAGLDDDGHATDLLSDVLHAMTDDMGAEHTYGTLAVALANVWDERNAVSYPDGGHDIDELDRHIDLLRTSALRAAS